MTASLVLPLQQQLEEERQALECGDYREPTDWERHFGYDEYRERALTQKFYRD